jgi:hypothetical protein
MRVQQFFPLFWVVLFAAVLPVLSWLTATSLAKQKGLEFEVSLLELEQEQQIELLSQSQLDADFQSLVAAFIASSKKHGISKSGITDYTVRVREEVDPEQLSKMLVILQNSSDRFFQPQTFYMGREGVTLGSNPSAWLERINEIRNENFVLAYQGRTLVLNDEF